MSFDLNAFSEGLADTLERAGAGVVRVQGRRGRGAATGAVWDDTGLVLTAHHVLRADEEVRVRLPDGTEADATIVGRHAATDLALLRTTPLPAPAWADTDRVRAGQLVLAVGRPGRGARATWGLVAGVGGPWTSHGGAEIARYLEVDASLPRGFSGGPLVDAAGRFLGVNTSRLAPGGTTVPTETVRRVVERLLSRGTAGRGYLGVGAHPVALPAAVAEQVGQDRACLVVGVEADSPAAAAGVLLGDALLAIDGAATRDVAEVAAILDEKGAGAAVTLKLLRAGAVVERVATLGAR